jgi:uncharacterized protein (TIGR00255 family)
MSISGMTGFSRIEGEAQDYRWTWEIKSVNGRGLDLKLRTPPGFESLDAPVREAAAARFKRGSLQANLAFAREAGAAAAVRIDMDLVEKLIAAGRPLIADGRVSPPSWDGLLAVRGVVVSDEAETINPEARAALDAALIAGFARALDGLAEARGAEGRMLAGALNALLDTLDGLTGAARRCAAAAPAALAERIRARLEALAPELRLDPSRLAQEAAMAATRADVQEELERLAAHAREARALLAKTESVGRRLDFLGQELTREANTLCAKSADIELTRIGLELKAAVDQFKEQAANVE